MVLVQCCKVLIALNIIFCLTCKKNIAVYMNNFVGDLFSGYFVWILLSTNSQIKQVNTGIYKKNHLEHDDIINKYRKIMLFYCVLFCNFVLWKISVDILKDF